MNESSYRPLVHVGFAKAGSTWLQQVFFPCDRLDFEQVGAPRADVYFRIIEPRVGFEPEVTRGHFESLMAEATGRPVVSSERLAGNPHSGGYDRFEIGERLKAVFPGGQILLMIREQLSIILSSYKQYLKVGGSASLAEYLSPTYQREGRIPQFDVRYFFYDRLIDHYLEEFGCDSVLVRPIEMLKTQPRRFISSILEFVEYPDQSQELVSELMRLTEIRKNVAMSPGSLALKRWINAVMGRNDVNPGAPLGWLAPANGHVNRALRWASSSLPEMDTGVEDRWRREVEAVIGKRYQSSNRRSSELMDVDLGQFGYDVS